MTRSTAISSSRKDGSIGGSLEAEVTVYADDDGREKLGRLEDELKYVFITSTAEVKPLAEAPAELQDSLVKGIKIAVAASHAEKCERCWHREESVGHLHEGICDRCSSNVYGDGEVRRFA